MDTSEMSSSLRSIVSALHKGFRKKLYSANTYSMTEIDTIKHLIHSPALLPSELAVLAKIKTQSMSQILNKLEEQGILVRTPSIEDKRKVYISLSPNGRKMVAKIKYDGDEWLKDLIEKSLSDQEMDLLKKALPILHKLTETK
jgi:DNA-binding MarR family transcriptional regulator